MLVFLGSALILWQSLKQKVVALFTCEAEYVVAATATCQAMWLRRLLGELTGVERLSCRTVATAGAGAKVSPGVISSHCSSMTAVIGLDG